MNASSATVACFLPKKRHILTVFAHTAIIRSIPCPFSDGSHTELTEHTYDPTIPDTEETEAGDRIAAIRRGTQAPWRGILQPSKRYEEISRLLDHSGEMTVEDFADRLGVSRETVRRDLTRLDAMGKLRKFHGGARTASRGNAAIEAEDPFTQRMAQNTDAKKRIASAARRLVASGDSLFIDTGSTTVAMAEALVALHGLVVITNAPRIAAIVAGNPSHKVFLIGGAYGVDAGESLGPLALEQIAKFRARHVILTVGAIDATSIMDFDLQEAEVAKAMIERSDRITVLVDHSKFNRRGVFEVAPLSAIDSLVTDNRPDAALVEALTAAGIELIIAE
ncbi:DeoR/GlpR family DNA-binding transcription regulator [Ensifer sp. M14]|uniref:DeoR/GlpR family DNA-binding transcription regulator n=1 Tax=Ensifer sp. M14 TaxID=2203782 RepID=UPI001FCE5B66|nr:DeoR/GlpR family DNA-binding transcription regulator [Ensifer sp. M14]